MPEYRVDPPPSFVQCPICGLSYKNYAQHYNLNHGQRYSKPRMKLPLGFATKHHLVYCACGDVFTGGVPIPPSIDRHWNRCRFITDASGAVSSIPECSHPHQFGKDAEPWTLPAGDSPRSVLPLRRSIAPLPAGVVYSRPRDIAKPYPTMSNLRCEQKSLAPTQVKSSQSPTSTPGFGSYENAANIFEFLTEEMPKEVDHQPSVKNHESTSDNVEAQNAYASGSPLIMAPTLSAATMYQGAINNTSFVCQGLAPYAGTLGNQLNNDFQMTQQWISQAQAPLCKIGSMSSCSTRNAEVIKETFGHTNVSSPSGEIAVQRKNTMFNEADMVYAINVAPKPLGDAELTSSRSSTFPNNVAVGGGEAEFSNGNVPNDLNITEYTPTSMLMQTKGAPNLFSESSSVYEGVLASHSMAHFACNSTSESSSNVSTFPNDDFQTVLSLHSLAMQKEN